MKRLLPHKNILGESPLWDEITSTFWWVDIKASQIHEYRNGEHIVHPCSFRPSALGLCTDSTLIVAAEQRILLLNPHTNEQQLICKLPEPVTNRTNDGKVGPDGAFWLGTMDDSEQHKTGSVYSFHPKHGLKKHLDGIGISNTFAWSPDASTFYCADSMEQTIWAFDFDMHSRELKSRRVFVSLKGSGFYPDGSAVDEHGCLWNAQWGGSRVVQYSANGHPLKTLTVPTSQPTSCAFVDTSLYVTTASIGLQTSDLYAGNLFSSPVAVCGTDILRYPKSSSLN